MIFRSVLLLTSLLSTSHAFMVVTPRTTSTCLYTAPDQPDEELIKKQAPTEQPPKDNILNSPAFLQRKLEVLKSDIAKVEEEIAVAQEQLEAGKAEWGPQLEDLQKEVRILLLLYGIVGCHV